MKMNKLPFFPTLLLKIILKICFQNFSRKYGEKYYTQYGRLGLQRMQAFKDRFISYGDYNKNITRI
jgi:hypothetical protein